MAWLGRLKSEILFAKDKLIVVVVIIVARQVGAGHFDLQKRGVLSVKQRLGGVTPVH
jgi:hypothetical protein